VDYYDLPPINPDQAKPGTNDYDIIRWCEARLQRGIKFLESQVGYDKIDSAIKEIFSYERLSPASYTPGPRSLSSTRANLVAKVAEDLVAMLTDTRCFWNYSTNNPRFEEQCRLANKIATRWYSDRLIDLRIGDVIRYWTVAGTGIAHIYYSSKINDMMLEAEDPRNVFPIDPLSYHSVQDCLGIITRRPRTPEWVKEEYDKVVLPESGGSTSGFFGWMQRLIDGPGERGGPLSKRSKGDQEIPHTPTVFVNTMYLHDKRKNKTDHVVRMGKWEDDKPAFTWSYEVKPGEFLYPFNRMIVWGGGVLMYDGPAPYWHSKFPLIKYTLIPWPNSWFGKAPTWDTIPLNNSINLNLRVIDDHAAQVAQPALIGDRNVSKAEMNKANTRSPGMKIRTNMASGKGLTIVPPPPLDPIIWELIKWCEEKMKYMAGTADPASLAALAQMPSDDTIDTLMKAMTPGVRLRSRILEGCYKELAEMFLYCTMQFDSLPKRIAEFGPQAVTKEDFDYAPSNMIPDDVPDGGPGDAASMVAALGLMGQRPPYQRAKSMLAAIEFKFDPSSLLNTAAKQDLMQYFVMAKMGYVSVFTLMEKMGIMNFAPANLKVPVDEISRLQLQQMLGIGMIANAQGRKATDSESPSMGQNAAGPTIQTS
jgi:hypothetical protein